MHTNASPSRPGFTLLELILVLVVVSIMLAVIGPRLTGVSGRQRSDAAAATVLSMMHECRARAINQGTPYRLVLEPDTRLAWVEALGPTGYARPEASYSLEYEWDKELTFDFEDWEQTDQEQWSLKFYPDGSAETAELRIGQPEQKVRVILAQTPGERYRISLGEPETYAEEGGFDVPEY